MPAFVLAGPGFAQNTDSLVYEIEKYLNEKRCTNPWPEDTVMIRNMFHLADAFEFNTPDSALYWRKEASEVLHKLIDDHQIKTIKHSIMLGDNYRAKGIILGRRGNYEKSVDFFIKSLDLYNNIERIPEHYKNRIKMDMAKNYNNLAIIYRIEELFELALGYNLRAQSVFYELLEEKPGEEKEKELLRLLALSLNNEGVTYKNMGDLETASKKYQQALNYFKILDFKRGMVMALNNIGTVEVESKNYREALSFYSQSLEITKELNDKNGIALLYNNMASAYYGLQNYEMTIDNAIKSYNISKEIKSIARLEVASKILSNAYHKLGNSDKAYNYIKEHGSYKDSIRTAEINSRIQEMEARYQNEKNQLKIQNLQNENELKEAEIQLKNRFITTITISLIIVVGLSIITFYQYITKKRANAMLITKNADIQNKNEEILSQRNQIESQFDEIISQRDMVANQKEMLEKFNNKLTDSIKYAQSIQKALLPDTKMFYNYFKEISVFEQASDIVSGDFYWMHPINNKTVIFAVADSTGHGVPGAFMSMLGITLLNDIIIKDKVSQPDEILNLLRAGFITALHQDDPNHVHNEGVDISLCLWDKAKKELHFAGARSQIWVLKNKANRKGDAVGKNKNEFEIQAYKGEKFTIGWRRKAGNFSKQIIPVGDDCNALYLFTDGIYDQLHHESQKRYTTKQFKDKILEIGHLSMQEQILILKKEYFDWKGDGHQIDDVTVVGIKF